MKPYLLYEYGNASQPYSFARTVKKALKNARETIALCINANADEIYFTSGGTESDNWAIKGVAIGDSLKRGIITSEFEHHAVLNSCKALERLEYPVEYLKPNKDGFVEPQSLKEVIDNPALVSIMYANNEIGTIQPIKELCEITHEHNALFHTDAVQAIGHVPIDVKLLNVDMLSASGHKFNAPKGIGFLYVKENVNLYPYIDGGSQERYLRAGTENVASIVGMATALKKNCDCVETNSKRLLKLENDLLSELKRANIDFIRNGNGNRLSGSVSLSFKGYQGEMLLHRLDLMGICVSTGSACDSQNTQISHVLKSINLDPEYAKGTIRVSFGVKSNPDDGFSIAKALVKILSKS
jgi:cysteine desulfurase